jgi:metal-responsive CopG/Arc/MetJ family transcriptional regulator
MSKSITVKRKRGRPATGRDQLIGVRLPDDMINSLDNWAKRNDCSRSEAIRRLVELGLKAKPGK